VVFIGLKSGKLKIKKKRAGREGGGDRSKSNFVKGSNFDFLIGLPFFGETCSFFSCLF